VAHPELLDDSLLDADVASQRRNIDSHLSFLRCVLDAGGLRTRLLLGERWQLLKVPTLFLRGEHDAFLTTRMKLMWKDNAARNPNLRVLRVPMLDTCLGSTTRRSSSGRSRASWKRARRRPSAMSEDPRARERSQANELRRRNYAKEAPNYDKQMGFFEKLLFGTEHRGWACSQAVGDTLEVAIGTGLNLVHYPPAARLTGVDLSPEMLALADTRARQLARSVELRQGDAQDLAFADRSFDTVVCTYALCSVPDEARAIFEMERVLKPGGRLILVDHVRSTVKPILWLQRLYEFIPSRTKGEYMTRRPALHVMAGEFDIQARDRLRCGIVERLVALKPGQ
jgi:ubiquinone/menaquinone biosynthesis C-methylase UbiE